MTGKFKKIMKNKVRLPVLIEMVDNKLVRLVKEITEKKIIWIMDKELPEGP